MNTELSWHTHNVLTPYALSILIPSWNNLAYLKLCVQSIQDHAQLPIQIIVVVNEGSDGTLAWLEAQKKIDYVHASSNVGICVGLNAARSLIKSNYIMYVNDDMYLLPNWDVNLMAEIKKINTNKFMLSCTMIEPHDTGNKCVLVKNYGDSLDNFNEHSLLETYNDIPFNDWCGSTWPPNLVHVSMWDIVGGLSIEFSPGMYSDPDFSKKLYEAGVRIFKGKANSRVYHFGSQSTKRIRHNKGRNTFLFKWRITANTFMKKYLQIGNPYTELTENFELSIIEKTLNKAKRMFAIFRN